jgi:hypothetical protein
MGNQPRQGSGAPGRIVLAMVVNLDKSGIDAAVLTIPSNFVAEDKGY